MIPMRALWSLLLFLFHATIVAASYGDYGIALLSWPWGRGSTIDGAALKPSTSQTATWTPSLRRLSLAHPTTTRDDAPTSTGTDDGTSPITSLSSKTTTNGESIASRTASVANSSDGASRAMSGATTSTRAKSASSTDTTSSSSRSSDTATATSSTVPSDSSGEDLQQPPTSGQNDTSSKKPYDGPLPTVFQWENEDTLNSTKDKQNTHGYFDLASRGPVNPVVDDVLQFLDDDQYKGTKRGRVGKIFPQEKEDPALWPLVAGGIFVIAAIILFAITAYNNCRKRREYQQIPGAVTDGGVV